MKSYVETYIAVGKAVKKVVPKAGFGPSNFAAISSNEDGVPDKSCVTCPYLLEFLKQIKAAEAPIDFIFASRYLAGSSSEDDTIVTWMGNKIFSLLGNIFFSLNISDILYTYVMGNTQKANSLNLKKKDLSLCVELPIKAKRAGFNLIDIKANERERIAGKKKVNAFKDGALILFEMIRLFFNK